MKSKKTLIMAVVVFVVAVAAVLGFKMKPSENVEHDYFLVNQGDKVLVMDALNPDEVVAEFENNNMGYFTYCSKDSSSFLLRENDNDEYPWLFDLVHYDVASGEKTLIDSKVTDYVVTDDFKTFVYVKENDCRLYKKSLTDSESSIITESARDFYMTDDGETLIYEDYSDKTYLKKGDAEAVFIGEDVTIRHFERTTGDFVYYAGTKLIVHKNDEINVITENLYIGDGMGHFGSCDNFYFAETQKEFSALDLFENDLSETLNLSDNEAESLHDTITEYFSEDYFNYTLRKVFYYDNGKISEVCDNVVDVFNSFATSPADKVAGIFMTYDFKNKLKLSDFYGISGYEIDGVFSNQFNALKTVNIAKKDTVVKTFEKKHILDCTYNYNTNEMYFLISDNTDVSNVDVYISDLCKISLEIGSDEITTIDSGKDMDFTSAAVIENEIHYQTFGPEGCGLYRNGEVIIENAEEIYEIGEDMFYISVIEDDKEKIMFYFNGEIHEYPEIDFANRFSYITENGNILVWKDNGEYFFVINGDSIVRIDKNFERLDTFSGEKEERGHNEYVVE